MTNQQVCRIHGGKAPRALLNAEHRQLLKQARQTETLGRPIPIDAAQAITEQIWWSNGHVNWYRNQIRAVHPDALTWTQTELKLNQHGLSETQRAQISVWLKLYNEERDRLTRYADIAVKNGLADREIRVLERYGEQLAHGMAMVLDRLIAAGLLDEYRRGEADVIVPAVLRELGESAEEQFGTGPQGAVAPPAGKQPL